MIRHLVLCSTLAASSLACSNGLGIDTTQECINSFRSSELQEGALAPGETAWAIYQDDWEGRTPVCWVNISTFEQCRSFSYDIEGKWAPAEWLVGEVASQPCLFTGVGQAFNP